MNNIEYIQKVLDIAGEAEQQITECATAPSTEAKEKLVDGLWKTRKALREALESQFGSTEVEEGNHFDSLFRRMTVVIDTKKQECRSFPSRRQMGRGDCGKGFVRDK